VVTVGRELAAAYAVCARIAREHDENFPVASRLLPRAMRPHVAAVYAFARTADDFADEGARTPAERYRLLDGWSARLEAAARGAPASPVGVPEEEAIFTALAHTIRTCRLPPALFADLLSAFRQDVGQRRYETWADVLDYCRRSANPVGRLVLRIAGHDDPALDRASDALCSALQLVNCWQDLARDWARGRLYVPREVLDACGAAEADLDEQGLTPAWRAALGVVAARTRALFDAGRALGDRVGGRLGWELRLTWLGGCRVLERLEAIDFDVFRTRPALGWRDAPVLLWRWLTWRGTPDAARLGDAPRGCDGRVA
jgi:squalene synthase HpnC